VKNGSRDSGPRSTGRSSSRATPRVRRPGAGWLRDGFNVLKEPRTRAWQHPTKCQQGDILSARPPTRPVITGISLAGLSLEPRRVSPPTRQVLGPAPSAVLFLGGPRWSGTKQTVERSAEGWRCPHHADCRPRYVCGRQEIDVRVRRGAAMTRILSELLCCFLAWPRSSLGSCSQRRAC
jgi:hypothetical protein